MKALITLIPRSIGFLGSIATIAAWLGITPEMVGEQAYAVLYAILPFAALTFGFMSGWSAKRWANEKSTTARRIARLSAYQRKLVNTMFVQGQIATSIDDDLTPVLDGLCRMGLVNGDGGLSRYWWLTEDCRRAIEAEQKVAP